jgi:small subunit ribosomal protein S25e
MGGVKKKPLAAMEKQQLREAQAEAKKKEQKQSQQQQQKRLPFLIPKMQESEIIKALTPLKAITVYNAARALGVNASVATMMLRTLEQKKLVKKVGGFSGHYIYCLSS